MKIELSNAVEAGRCEECGLGGMTGTAADKHREEIPIWVVSLSNGSPMRLCYACRQQLLDALSRIGQQGR